MLEPIPFHLAKEERRRRREAAVAAGIKRGLSYAQVGAELGCSNAAIAQTVRKSPNLRRLVRSHSREADLRRIIHEASLINQELAQMRTVLRRIARDASEELDAIATDRLLGL